jgi:hypothetical protein
MVPCADGNSTRIQHLPYIEVVDTFNNKRYNANFLRRRPNKPDTL